MDVSRLECCDLVLYEGFAEAHSLVERVRATGLFNEVWGVVPFYPEYHHLGTTYLKESFFQPLESKVRFYSGCPFLEGRNYDVFMCACANRLSLDAKRYCVPRGYSIFFDDGAGSHSGNVFKNFACFDTSLASFRLSLDKKERLKSLARRVACVAVGKEACFNIKQIWLLGPTETEEKAFRGVEVRRIPLDDASGVVARALGGGSDPHRYEGVRHIYLVSSGFLPEETLRWEQKLIEELDKKLGGKLYLRLHPNRSSDDFPDMLERILPRDDLWELLIGEGVINDESVLYGLCTTAQMTPKTIYGLEPTLVMLYRLVSPQGLPITDFGQMAGDLQHRYHHRERVIIPETEDEFWASIDQFGTAQS